MYRYYQPYDRNQGMNVNTSYTTLIDPFVVSRLQSVMGKMLIVETTNDTIRGDLIEVQPDHISLKAGDSIVYVRIQQIVSIMPV